MSQPTADPYFDRSKSGTAISKSPEKTSDNSLTTVLLVPSGAVNDRTGGGQRTSIIFDALKQFGPVYVLVDGAKDHGVSVFFPDAREVQTFGRSSENGRFSRILDRKLNKVMRVLFPSGLLRVDPELASQVADLVERVRPDLIVVRYAPLLGRSGLRRQTGIKLLLDVDDRDDQKLRSRLEGTFGANPLIRWLIGLLVFRTLDALNSLLDRCDHVWISKAEDQFKIGRPASSILFNVPFFPPATGEAHREKADQTVLFVGSFGHTPNRSAMRWFLRFVWPGIVARLPTARLRVVGLGDWRGWSQAYASLRGVEFVGSVEDIAPEYRAARLAICPVQIGAGSQIKVIEACAFGVPIVTTSFAAKGFGPRIAETAILADNPDEFRDACLRFLMEPDYAFRTGMELMRIQAAEYSREAAYDRIRTDVSVLFPDRPLPADRRPNPQEAPV